MYNYEEKYEADDWGWEMRQESRFYRTFVDECDIYDIEKMEGWRDVLDVLLVFVRFIILSHTPQRTMICRLVYSLQL